MKRFDFRLQPLLNYRKYLERLAQQGTAKAQMDILDCERQIVTLKNRLDIAADQIDDIVSRGTTAAWFKQYHNYLDAMENEIEYEKNRKMTLKKILEEKLKELKKKSVEKKAMELLREKRAKQYSQELLKDEQKSLDEVSSLKKAREISNEV